MAGDDIHTDHFQIKTQTETLCKTVHVTYEAYGAVDIYNVRWNKKDLQNPTCFNIAGPKPICRTLSV
jgi:hypothetical protein